MEREGSELSLGEDCQGSCSAQNDWVYYDENQALIVPKEDFKDRFVPIMTMVTQHVRPGCVRLR